MSQVLTHNKKRKRGRAHSGYALRTAVSVADSLLPSRLDQGTFPDMEEMEALIKDVCGNYGPDTVIEDIVNDLTSKLDEEDGALARRALHSMFMKPHHVDADQVEVAMAMVNEANNKIHDRNKHLLHSCLQQHGGCVTSRMSVSGTFPTTTVMAEGVQGRNDTLSCLTNATNIATSLLLSPDSLSPVRNTAIVSDLIPTTVPGQYTNVPGPQIFTLFKAPYYQLIESLYVAGLDTFVGIANSNASAVIEALEGIPSSEFRDVVEGYMEVPRAWQVKIMTLREMGGSRLLLVVPMDENRLPYIVVSQMSSYSHDGPCLH